MVSKVFEIALETGMHARPAGLFVKTIGPLSCNVNLKVGERTFNGKSIMAIMSAGLKKGEMVEVICEGADEEKALEAIGELFELNFNE